MQRLEEGRGSHDLVAVDFSHLCDWKTRWPDHSQYNSMIDTSYEAFQYNSQQSRNEDRQIIRINKNPSFALLYCSPVHNMNWQKWYSMKLGKPTSAKSDVFLHIV